MWITDCKYFHIFSKCAISGIYHSVDGGRFPRSYRICYFCSLSAENKQNKWRTWLTVRIATYSVFTDLRDAIFAWLCACPEWSLWRSISVSKQVCMCLQLPSPTCGTQLGPSPVCLVSIGDLLRLDLQIQRAGFGPWSKCRSGNNNPGYYWSKAPVHFCWRQGQALLSHIELLVMKQHRTSLGVSAQIQRLNGRSILA